MVSGDTSAIYKADKAVLLSRVPKLEWREAHVIQALIMECGWQVQELAEKAKLNPSVLYRLLDGRVKEPSKKTLAKIAAAFGVTVIEIRSAVPTQPMVFAADLPKPNPPSAKIAPKKRAAI